MCLRHTNYTTDRCLYKQLFKNEFLNSCKWQTALCPSIIMTTSHSDDSIWYKQWPLWTVWLNRFESLSEQKLKSRKYFYKNHTSSFVWEMPVYIRQAFELESLRWGTVASKMAVNCSIKSRFPTIFWVIKNAGCMILKQISKSNQNEVYEKTTPRSLTSSTGFMPDRAKNIHNRCGFWRQKTLSFFDT